MDPRSSQQQIIRWRHIDHMKKDIVDRIVNENLQEDFSFSCLAMIIKPVDGDWIRDVFLFFDAQSFGCHFRAYVEATASIYQHMRNSHSSGSNYNIQSVVVKHMRLGKIFI